jgi:ACR3 family arsenite transporter
VHAFVWLIAVPLALAALVQFWAGLSKTGQRVTAGLGLLPVPATALVLGSKPHQGVAWAVVL